MDFTKLSLTLPTLAKSNFALLIGTRPWQEYIDGKRTDRVIGTCYDLVFPKNGYEKITVKTPELTPAITNEEIGEDGEGILVAPVGFVGKLYRTQTGSWDISAKAATVQIVDRGEESV